MDRKEGRAAQEQEVNGQKWPSTFFRKLERICRSQVYEPERGSWKQACSWKGFYCLLRVCPCCNQCEPLEGFKESEVGNSLLQSNGANCPLEVKLSANYCALKSVTTSTACFFLSCQHLYSSCAENHVFSATKVIV